MTFGTALYTVFLKPLQLVFEIIYSVAYQNTHNPGLAIIVLSLAINLLALPLYRHADAFQKEKRDTEVELNKRVTCIQRVFHCDEDIMMHAQHIYILRDLIFLFLEILLFVVAYHTLSELEMLEGASLGPIADLSQPDALLRIESTAVNVLPILMTVVNIIFSAFYLKNSLVKKKIQFYGIVALYLLVLYSAPSGLVVYWMVTAIFFILKNCFYKFKHPKQILSVLSALSGAAVILGAFCLLRSGARRKFVFVAFCGLLLFLPLVVLILKKKGKLNYTLPTRKPNANNFIFTAFFLAALTGLLIPSTVLVVSPQEFIDIQYFVHPLWYIVYSFLLAVGFFVFWFGAFYCLASPQAKPVFECSMWALCSIAMIDYLFFGTNLGTMSSDLIYDKELVYTIPQIFVNGVAILAVVGFFTFMFMKWNRIVSRVLSVALAAVMCMTAVFCISIQNSVASVDLDSLSLRNTSPHFMLSKTGKNVVVIELDRAMGEYIPYIFNEKPELKEQFSGFTYYSNVISFGGHTNFATPALYGGYEYTPIELNKRDLELLKDKQNEALKVMPVLFDENGYDVTVFDPPYAGYSEIPDLSIYSDYPNINCYITKGYFVDSEEKETQVENRNRNFFCYGLTKISPLFFQRFLYNEGDYHQMAAINGQTVESLSRAYGLDNGFMKWYNVLQNMSSMTSLTEDECNTFLMMSNDITHNPTMLSEPEYLPEILVDNTEYDAVHSDRFTLDGYTLTVDTASQMSAYHSNAAAMVQLGAWFDYLRENGTYDNTRIILVADHGFALAQMDNFVLDSEDYQRNIDERYSDVEFYYPLLMVKDFDANGFNTSDEFMTNADVPTLAIMGLFEDSTNPMTGKPINNAEKAAHDQFIIASSDFSISINNGTTFLPARWYSVHDSIWEQDNWMLVAENAILPFDLEEY